MVRNAATALALGTVGLLFGACGGASSPGVASLGSTTTTSASTAAQTSYAKSLKYAQCMRAHGNSNFPNPSADGAFDLYRIPLSVSASDLCQHFLGPGAKVSAAQQQELLAKALKFSRCMRAHGFADYPDPSPIAGGGVSWKSPPGFDLRSAVAERAIKACPGFITIGNPGHASFRP
jgi:hypothetical protein